MNKSIPDKFAELSRSARAAFEIGALVDAERLAHGALRLQPASPPMLALWGAIQLKRGNPREATKAFRKLAQQHPTDLAAWSNLGTAARAAGDSAQALAAYREAQRLGADDSDFHFSIAMLLSELGQLQDACTHLQWASARSPRDVEIQLRLAECHFLCADNEATLSVLSKYRAWGPLGPEQMASVASLLLQVGEQQEAEVLLGELQQLQDGSPWVQLTVAEMLERTNRIELALLALDRAGRHPLVGTDPALRERLCAVQARLAERSGQLELAARRYQELIDGTRTMEERHFHLFPLAKVVDALKDHESALAVAKQAHLSQVAYVRRFAADQLGEDRPVMAVTEFAVHPDDVKRWHEQAPPRPSDSPIFIVAFPRSGTTLLEQMLDAHPQLVTMDEQPYLQQTVLQFGQRGRAYPHALADMSDAELVALRAYYWGQVRARVSLAPGQRLIDKNPLNMLRLPAIRRLFPNAKILLAIRHPCDVVASNFFQHYRAPEFVRLCKDLGTLALAWRRSFDFWYSQQALLRADVREVFYERFVSSFESESRDIAAFLGVDWHASMLDPAANARKRGYISTPSYSQVVQPVNLQAVGRWKRYGTAMDEVVEQVRPYLLRWHYVD